MIESYLAYTSTTHQELREFGQMFSLLDLNHDGIIEESELRAAFQASS